MAQTVAQHQLGAISTPANGAALVASVVRGNFQTVRTGYNDHDADSGVHFQSSTNASRPAAGTAGRKWLDTDTLRIYFDTGSVWSEIAYGTTASPTFTGTVTVASLTASGTITGTLATAAQPNITSLGTIAALVATQATITTIYPQIVDVEVGGSGVQFRGTAALGSKSYLRWIDVEARVNLGNGAAATALGPTTIATNSSIGYVHIPEMSGTPVGTPTATGGAPMVLDISNNRLWFYHTSDWHYVALTATP